MTQVKELFDSLSDEQKKAYGLGMFGIDEQQRHETSLELCQWLTPLFPPDQLQGKFEEFLGLLMSDVSTHLARLTSGLNKDEGEAQVKSYFESLSDRQKLTLAGDLLGTDEQKRNKAMQSLWKFDGDLRDNTKYLLELIKNYVNMMQSLPHVQKQLKEKKDEGDKNEREYLAAERKRVNDVVCRHKELHPPQTRECSVCLDDVEMTEHNSMVYFYCCGQGTCRECYKKNVDSGGTLFKAKCPYCRGDIINEVAARTNLIKKCAEKGLSFAQYKMALYCNHGIEESNIPIDGKKWIEWLQLASENNSPDLDAMVDLASAYYMGTAVEKSKEKAVALLKKAADMGSRRAQDRIAIYLYDEGKNGSTSDAIYYATLAIGERQNFVHYGAAVRSAFVLGCAFHYGDVVEENPYLARHYLKIAVQGNTDELVCTEAYVQEGYEKAYSLYGEALFMLQDELYDGKNDVPGFSSIPKAMYWFHKAAAVQCGCGDPKCWRESSKRKGKRWIDKIKAEESKKCSYCSKKAEDCPGGKLKNCAKCSGAWYCSRDCQVAAWKAGHKRDCVSKDAPKEAALH